MPTYCIVLNLSDAVWYSQSPYAASLCKQQVRTRLPVQLVNRQVNQMVVHVCSDAQESREQWCERSSFELRRVAIILQGDMDDERSVAVDRVQAPISLGKSGCLQELN
jgi:hypothetical protein